MNEILKLECVRSVELWPNGNIVVYIWPQFTDGNTEVKKDEYIVKWDSGKYQRYGAIAFTKLFKNPGKEAGKAWPD